MPLTPVTSQTILGQTNAGAQFAPAVAALPGSAYVISWLDSQRGGIYAQRYDSAGAPIGTEFRVDSPGPAPLFSTVAALTGGGFVIAWQYSSFASADIHAQRYDANGVRVGTEFTVNSSLPNEQLGVRVIGLSNGGFLFTWDNIVSDTYQDISARLYNAAGEPVGPDFTINTTTADSQGISSIAPLAGGGFVATWQSVSPAGSGKVLLIGQLFNAAGGKVGTEFQVNTDTTHNPVGNDVATLSDGSFVVSWVDPSPNNTGGRIVARHYAANGIALSGEVVIATAASGGFGATSVTALADGAYVVLWADKNNAVDHVFARAVGANDVPLDAAVTVSNDAPFPSIFYADAAATLANGNVVFAWDGPSTNTSEDVYYRQYSFTASASNQPTTGPDTLTGTSGPDVLNGLGGADTMTGLGGNDVYFVDDPGDRVIEAMGEGNDTVYSSVSYLLSAGTEVETLGTTNPGGNATLALTGNELGQTIIGNAGDNFLSGGGGADTLNGGAGNDVIIVDQDDLVIEAAGGGNDLVAATSSFALNAGAEVETLSTTYAAGTLEIALTGNAFGQTIIGNAGNNFLSGGGGADTLDGGAGNDVIIVDSDDRVIEAVGGGNDLVASLTSYTLNGGAEVETLSTTYAGGIGAINLTGNEFGQTVIGNAGANVLNGGLGADTLQGLGGADTFAFTTALGAGNVDTIADFVSGTDKIGLAAAIFSGIGSAGNPFNANAFFAGTAAHEADDRIIYDAATGNLYYDADGNGAGAQVLVVTLQGHPALTISDFTVI